MATAIILKRDRSVDNQYVIAKIFDFIIHFLSIVWEAMPFIVLGAIVAGFLEELLPQRFVARILPRSKGLSILVGGLLGIIFPMCECGIIPVMRRLIRKGFPLSCCVAYLLAGPIVNPVVMASTFAAFSGMEQATEPGGKLAYQMGSWWMMGLRSGIGYLIAVTTAFIVEGAYRKYGNALLTPLAMPSAAPLTEDEEKAIAGRPWIVRVNNIAETALHDFIDITAFLVLGALLTATVRIWLTQEVIAELSRDHAILSILLMMALAVALCLCSEADAFVAASLKSLRPAAKLSFLTLGPMLDIKLYLMYTRIFRPRLIWTIFLSVIVQVFIYSLIVHLLWEHYAPQLMGPGTVSVPSTP